MVSTQGKAPGFTPGPWNYCGGIHPVPQVNAPCARKTVAVCGLDASGAVEDVSGADGMPGIEADANARLIAAAPDLYAALREMVECEDAAENHPEGWEALFERFAYALQDARAAIAKAEGRTP